MNTVLTSGTPLNAKGWQSHVIKITNPNATSNSQPPTANSTEINNGIAGYYVTWRR